MLGCATMDENGAGGKEPTQLAIRNSLFSQELFMRLALHQQKDEDQLQRTQLFRNSPLATRYF
jgi:hypothetical protein